jgi:hypothetical protein
VPGRAVEANSLEMSQERPNEPGIRRGWSANGVTDLRNDSGRPSADQSGFALVH